MSAFKPLTFRTARGYELSIARLNDVVKAISMAWPDKECELYRNAAHLAEKARQGWCTPRSAYDAFIVAARAQGCIVECRPLRDRVAKQLAAIEPENFNPLPTLHLSQPDLPDREAFVDKPPPT